MMAGNGQLSVPPGFRFHPTDEELLYYYLKKKVSYEAIDLDVIREVDLNKLEPWDLKDKCRIGSGPQSEWYFFSHKDKKYPTGTRTNRATTAGFWKATGRDKAIHTSNSKRIGMRKTLVFYTGRAPHGQKTDWIMHEYRLDDDNSDAQQEDGWVVCRVFKKKNQTRSFLQQNIQQEELEHHHRQHHHQPYLSHHSKPPALSSPPSMEPKQSHVQSLYDCSSFDGAMHLPQLFSPESAFMPPPNFSMNSIECSQNLLRLTSPPSPNGCGALLQPPADHRFHGGWSFLDKLLACHDNNRGHSSGSSSSHHHQVAVDHLVAPTSHRFSFPYIDVENDLTVRFSK